MSRRLDRSVVSLVQSQITYESAIPLEKVSRRARTCRRDRTYLISESTTSFKSVGGAMTQVREREANGYGGSIRKGVEYKGSCAMRVTEDVAKLGCTSPPQVGRARDARQWLRRRIAGRERRHWRGARCLTRSRLPSSSRLGAAALTASHPLATNQSPSQHPTMSDDDSDGYPSDSYDSDGGLDVCRLPPSVPP